jgi:hypothetical protein
LDSQAKLSPEGRNGSSPPQAAEVIRKYIERGTSEGVKRGVYTSCILLRLHLCVKIRGCAKIATVGPPKKRVKIVEIGAGSGHVNPLRRLKDICHERHSVQSKQGRLHLVVNEDDELHANEERYASTKPPGDNSVSLCDLMSDFKIFEQKNVAT